MRKIIILLLLLSIAACGSPSEPELEPTAVIAEATVAEPTAVPPTNTPEPTDTPKPTATSAPTATPEPEPTATTAVPPNSVDPVIYGRLRLLELSQRTAIAATGRVLGSATPEAIAAVHQIADELGILLPDFNLIAEGDAAAFEDYILDAENVISDFAQAEYGEPAAAIVDLFMFSSIANIVYFPDLDEEAFGYIVDYIRVGGTYSGLSSTVYMPILDAIVNKEPYETVSAAIDDMLDFVISGVRSGAITYAPVTVDSTVNTQWQLAKLAESVAIAALAQGYGLSEETVTEEYTAAQALSSELGVALPDLYAQVSYGDFETGLAYTFDVQASLKEFASANLGDEAAAIVELIMSGKVTQIIYEPGDDERTAVFYMALYNSGEASGLPSEFYQPVLDGMAGAMSWEDVGERINLMVFEIQRFLETSTQ